MKNNVIVEDIIKTGKILYQKDFIYATNGNMSVRKGNKIYITATGLCKGELKSKDIKGKTLESGPVFIGV